MDMYVYIYIYIHGMKLGYGNLNEVTIQLHSRLIMNKQCIKTR